MGWADLDSKSGSAWSLASLDAIHRAVALATNRDEEKAILGSSLSFDRYEDACRVLFRDHIFWRGLLPRYGYRARFLVLETRLGGVALGLADGMSDVVALHATTEAAQLSQARAIAEERSLDIHVVNGTMGSIPSGDQLYDAIVIINPAGDPTGQWGSMSGFVNELILNSRRLLTDSGIVILVDGNRFGYRVILRKLTRWLRGGTSIQGRGLPGVWRMFSLAGLSVTGCYLSRSDADARLIQSMDYRHKSERMPPLKGHVAWLIRAKEIFLHTKVGACFWPSFLAIATPKRSQSFIESLVEQKCAGSVVGWPCQARAEVRRIVAGNEETTVVIVGPVARNDPEVVVRLPYSKHGEELCATNSEMLRRLQGGRLARMVPELLSNGVAAGRHYSIEQRCSGLDMGSIRQNVDRVAIRAMRALFELREGYSEVLTLTKAIIGENIDEMMMFSASSVTQSCAARIGDLHSRLVALLEGRCLTVGLMHGDYKLGNLLIDSDKNSVTIIDWDHGRWQGLPIFDLIHLVVFQILQEETELHIADAYLKYVIPWKLPFGWGHEAFHMAKIDCPDEVAFLGLRIAHYFYMLRYRLGSMLTKHPEWQSRFLDPVLAGFEDALADAGG